MMLTITIDTARRFILGKQGLWPGRRWHGVTGTEQAMRAIEYLQLDPLHIIARSQDITLHSRVLEYTPGLWEAAAYQQRRFFDWGGWLACRPMDELPHWRVVMRRERENNARMRSIARDHADAIVEMRAILRERGTVSNRDFAMATRTRTQSYRGRKDSALALYYLWLTGDVMTHHRERFERVYALTETVAPAHLMCESDEAEADRFLIKKDVSFSGLSRLNRVQDSFQRGVPFGAAKQICAALVADGDLIEVQVEGWKALHYALGSDAALLHDLSAGRVPTAWTPLETSTTDEVVFLAPLDQVSARTSQAPLWLRLRVGGLQACAPAQVRLLHAADLVGRPACRAVRQQARPDDQHVRDPRPVVGGSGPRQRCGICGGSGTRVCALRDVSRREQTGSTGDSRAAAAPTRLCFLGSNTSPGYHRTPYGRGLRRRSVQSSVDARRVREATAVAATALLRTP